LVKIEKDIEKIRMKISKCNTIIKRLFNWKSKSKGKTSELKSLKKEVKELRESRMKWKRKAVKERLRATNILKKRD
jgi:peptidoglycan hydrolase CwlO-like protein